MKENIETPPLLINNKSEDDQQTNEGKNFIYLNI